MPPSFDLTTFLSKQALFEREFHWQEMRDFDRSFCPEPADLLSYEQAIAQFPHFQKLIVDAPEIRDFIAQYLDRLVPFCQAPFPLPGEQVTKGPWIETWKLMLFTLCDVNRTTVANKRVLDIGCNAGWDTFFLSSLDPCEIIGVEPSPFYYQALFLAAVYHRPQVRFCHAKWESVTKDILGTFDVINCQGILYHEKHPLLLLERLYDLLAPGGKLILETHVTMQDDLNAIFVEGTYYGGPDWWWIPSSNAVAGMLRTAGFKDVQQRFRGVAPSNNPENPDLTVEGLPAGGRACFVAFRSF